MSDAAPKRLPTGVAVTAGVLLAIPVLALLFVGLYADEDPELWGFPVLLLVPVRLGLPRLRVHLCRIPA